MGKKIIVVDDSSTVRTQVVRALVPGGFEVLEATDGLDGLLVIQRTPDAAMVIVDVNMPRMSGLEMLDSLKKGGGSPPVLMLTAEGQPALIERAKKAGAKGWMVKPFKADLLLAAVQKIAGSPA